MIEANEDNGDDVVNQEEDSVKFEDSDNETQSEASENVNPVGPPAGETEEQRTTRLRNERAARRTALVEPTTPVHVSLTEAQGTLEEQSHAASAGKAQVGAALGGDRAHPSAAGAEEQAV